MDINIKQTALKIQKGDEQAFREFYEAYFGKLYRFLMTILRNADDAEDVTSVAFIYVWDNKEKLRRPEQLVSWLYQVAKHRAFDHLRKHAGQVKVSLAYLYNEPLEHQFSPERIDEKLNASQTVARLLNGLSPEDRSLLHLRFAEDLSFSEIGERLGSAAVTVRVRLHRIIKLLQSILSEDEAQSVVVVTKSSPKTAPSYD